MAGRVRHPIDMRALERWIEKNIPEIEVPLEIKQVRSFPLLTTNTGVACPARLHAIVDRH